MPTDETNEIRRTLNHWNARRYAWGRFQDDSRRTAERMARAAATEPITLDQEDGASPPPNR